MKEHPIIFNADMVRAILAGRKTQARQILNADTPETRGGRWDFIGDSAKKSERNKWCYSWIDQWGNRISPKGKEPCCLVTPPSLPGDGLWVRENWAWYPRDTALAFMLAQLENHLPELGKRCYAGDQTVVDEFLQLYYIEEEAREAVKQAKFQESEGG